MFAYTSYLGYFVEYKTSITYLFGEKHFNVLKWIYYVPVIFAVLLPIDAIWSIADISVGFIIIPNLIALVLLGKDFKKLVQEFKEGSEKSIESVKNEIYKEEQIDIK